MNAGSISSPVDSRRSIRRSSRYSCPRSRAAVTSAEVPDARSCSSRPSRTLIVVWNDPRVEPFSCSQFHPPSARSRIGCQRIAGSESSSQSMADTWTVIRHAMAEVLLFHHAQGQTRGFLTFADDVRAAGHVVHTPDLYDGKTFTDLDAGVGYA